MSGESFPYLGRHYRLKVQEGHRVGVCLSGGYLRATIRPTEQGEQREARIQHYLQSWYRARALVVIHELCHLIHPNHSKAFWQLVGRHDAAFAAHRQWLKQRGEGLL